MNSSFPMARNNYKIFYSVSQLLMFFTNQNKFARETSNNVTAKKIKLNIQGNNRIDSSNNLFNNLTKLKALSQILTVYFWNRKAIVQLIEALKNAVDFLFDFGPPSLCHSEYLDLIAFYL